MPVIMAGKTAGLCGARIGDRSCAVRRDHVGVEVDEPFARNAPAGAAHAVCRMARGARKPVVDVPPVLTEACIGGDVLQIVTLCAKRVRAVDAEIRTGVQVRNELPWRRCLAEIVSSFEDVGPL